jgi:hypothetical protein
MKSFKLVSAGSILLLSIILAMSSCGKYEDGPGLSLRAKKARLDGDWQPKEYTSSEGITMKEGDELWPFLWMRISFRKDGAYVHSEEPFAFSGTWEFADEKKVIHATVSSGAGYNSTAMTILRLTNKELWIRITSNEGNMGFNLFHKGDTFKFEKRTH